MTLPAAFGDGLDATGGFVLAALGAWIWTLTPTRATRGLALFALGVGLSTGLHNLLDVLVLGGTVVSPALQSAVSVLFAIPALFGLIAIGRSFPSTVTRGERPQVLAAAGVGLAGGALGLLAILIAGSPRLTLDPAAGGADPVGIWSWGSMMVVLIVSWWTMGLVALRYPAHAQEPGWPRSAAITTCALVLYPVTTGAFFAANPDRTFALHFIGTVAASITLILLWLRNGSTTGNPRLARNVVLVIAGSGALSMVLTMLRLPGLFGAARTLAVLILSYAILRHRMLGIDAKVRWTLSKTTLAGILVAVFFIVSEGAQQFFGERAENQYLGILAAGALVFAITPLSRLADRLAAKAVPMAGARTEPRGAARHEDAYRRALRIAMRDGRLTRDDEVELAALADVLGIQAGRAATILRDLERETGGS